MLILLTLFLVLVGTVSLIIGFIQNSLVPIYASIGCSVAAALVLVLYSRIANRPAPGVRLSDTGRADEEPAGEEVVEELERTATVPAARDNIAEPVAAAPAPTTEAPVSAAAENPIPDYRTLKVGEIVPLLSGLTVEQLHAVRRAEVEGKSRTTVLNRIDQLLRSPGQPQAQRPSRPAKKAAPSSRAPKAAGASGAKRAAKKTPAQPLTAAAQEQAGTPAAPAEQDPVPTGPVGAPEAESTADRPGGDHGLRGVVWDPTEPSGGNGSPPPQVPSPQSETGNP